MNGLLEIMEEILIYVVRIGTSVLEMFGICILLSTAVRCFYLWLTKNKDHNIRLLLGQGIALGLEFKMGGEVLRTVIVREWTELGILGATIGLRGLLTFLIHWEIENEKKDQEIELERRKVVEAGAESPGSFTEVD